MNIIQMSSGHIVLISDVDFDRVSTVRWHLCNGYAIRRVCGVQQLMHRFILSAPDGVTVDHINGNPLDNRRENLRLCTQAQNSKNNKGHRDRKSKYKGVSVNRAQHPSWCARLGFDTKNKGGITVGYFSTEEAAARAYDRAAHEADPEFSRLNFSDGIWSEEKLNTFRLTKPTSSTGYSGVVKSGRKFAALTRINGGKKTYFGTFDTPELAHAAVQLARSNQPLTT